MGKSLIHVGEEMWVHLQRSRLGLEELTAHDESICGQYVLTVIGKVRVTNLAFNKSVFARMTFNNWASYRDYTGSYIESSKDGTTDVFAFGFKRRDKKPVNVEFAICCCQDGKEYWDSNDEKNYSFYLSEDPLNESTILDSEPEPEVVTTSCVVEESSPEKELEELIFDPYTYAHFQAHPLTPTKTNLYSSFNNAPEKKIVSVKANTNRHVRAYNALALNDLFDAEEKPTNIEESQIEATSATLAEAGVCMTGEEIVQHENENQVEVDPAYDHIQEEAIEPVNFTKPVDEQSADEVFDKLEKEKEQVMQIQLQITEEPGDDTHETTEGERNGTTAVTEQNWTEEEPRSEKIDEIPEGEKSINNKKKSKEEKKNKKKKDKKKVKKSKKEEKHSESEQKSGSEQKLNEQNQKQSQEQQKADDQSLENQKERIEDEPPQKPKKGFLSRMACCGKAEPD